MSEDQYSKIDYKRLIAWGDRLVREWPLLEETLAAAPSRRLLDLGSGTGEHARFLATQGFDVTGIDSSPSMIEKSLAEPAANARFVQGDLREADSLVDGRFGGAICLGNVLPHLVDADDLSRLAASVRKVLEPGAPLIIQMLNYDRIEAKKERALPLSFLPDPEHPGSTLVFLRLIDLRDDGRAIFMPTTLRQRPEGDPPLEMLSSRRVEIRAWRRADVESALRANGFSTVTLWGSYGKTPFDPAESRDVVVIAK